MGGLSLVLHLLCNCGFFFFFNTLDNKFCCGILDSVIFFHRELIYFLLSLLQRHSLAAQTTNSLLMLPSPVVIPGRALCLTFALSCLCGVFFVAGGTLSGCDAYV